VVTEIAGRIVTALAAPTLAGDVATGVGASVGVATEVGVGSSPDELIHRADVAMYAAKANGKGRVQQFVPGLMQGGLSRVPADR
jgi:GGDEF domain-containing protein